MSRKNKFNLAQLLQDGLVKESQKIIFVSDPTKFCTVKKMPNGDCKLETKKGETTVHHFAQECLGQDPPDHAAKWLRTENGVTLYELWQKTIQGED